MRSGCACVVCVLLQSIRQTHKWQQWDLTIYDGSFIFFFHLLSKATTTASPWTPHIRQYTFIRRWKSREREGDDERRACSKKTKKLIRKMGESVCALSSSCLLRTAFCQMTRFSFCKCILFSNLSNIRECRTRDDRTICMYANKYHGSSLVAHMILL